MNKNRSCGVATWIIVVMLLVSMLTGIVLPTSINDNQPLSGAGTFRVAVQDGIYSLNPLVLGDTWMWNICDYMYETPMRTDFETGELVPYIAVGSANLSADLGTIDWSDCTVGNFGHDPKNSWNDVNKPEAIIFYDFKNVTWHDGTQMTIRDVLFSYNVAAQMPDWTGDINYLKDKAGEVGSNYPNDHYLFIEKVWESGTQAALKFTLQEPYAYFFVRTLSVFLLPYHIWGFTISGQSFDNMKIWYDPGYLPDNPDAWDADDAKAYENANPIGSAPFQFDSWDKVFGRSLINTWRDHFNDENYTYSSDGKQPNIDAMQFKVYKTSEQAVLALRNDEVDFISWPIPPTFVEEMQNDPDISMQVSPVPGFYYMAYNMRIQSFGYDETATFPYAPSDDLGKPFRKAVAHCIDKERIVQRLLMGLGEEGIGPVGTFSSWFNNSLPIYPFDSQDAIDILTNAGYQKTDGPASTPGPGNWWLRPDGTPIGSGPGGKIEILTPQADYDPIRAQSGLMIAQELQNIGIFAESVAMDFGSIVNRIDMRDFDMYILGWKIDSEPPDYMHRFFHSSPAVVGQNYPGYQNQSCDTIIDLARQSDVESERIQAIKDAQASIAFDRPYDVLYYRTNIQAYRSDNFVGWVVDDYGTLFNWETIINLSRPSTIRLKADFVSPPSTTLSNSTIPLSVLVRNPDWLPVQGANVKVNTTSGSLTVREGLTAASGKLNTMFTAPYVPPTQDNINNGTILILEIEEATHAGYDPAPARIKVIRVYPVGVDFLTVSMFADPDVIDPDVDGVGTPGWTYVEVTVVDENGDPAVGVNVTVEVAPAIPDISPTTAVTDANGKATFTLISTDLPDNDNSINEFTVDGLAYHPTDPTVKNGTQKLRVYIVDKEKGLGPFPPTINLISPANNSIIKAGTIINLDVTDPELNIVNYSHNGGVNQTLNAPYDINTTGWSDGVHVIEVHANDTTGESSARSYNFTMDSTDPTITLDSPANSSVIQAGTIIHLTIADDNLDAVNYSLNGGANQTLTPPYNIDTSAWLEGVNNVEIHAIDEAGNTAVESYTFTIDKTPPTIALNSPTNNSIIRPGTLINLSVTNGDLALVNYSVNAGANQTLTSPYNINTAGWSDGVYVIEIHAIDGVNNAATEIYSFIIDGTAPTVVSTTPINDATEVAFNTSIVIEFSESMNSTAVVGALLVNPTVSGLTYNWNADDSILTIELSTNLTSNTSYNINVGIGAKDIAGNPFTSAFSFSFTTWLDSDNDGIPDSQDPDDDDDGFLDEWEALLGTDPKDSADKPVDTDGDGIPDGDATNSQAWMDDDDDGDGVLDEDDPEPLNPDVTEVPEGGGIGEYWWAFVVLVACLGVAISVFFFRKPKAPLEFEKE